MLPPPVIRPAVGVTNGVNTTFFTPDGYVSGTLRVWLNGLLMRADYDDGWTETGPNKFQMKQAPHVGDVVQAYYVPG